MYTLDMSYILVLNTLAKVLSTCSGKIVQQVTATGPARLLAGPVVQDHE
jgi:hypothetical protein